MSITEKREYLEQLDRQLEEVGVDQAIRVRQSQLGMASELDRLLEAGFDSFAYSDPTRRELTAPNSYSMGMGGRPDDYEGGKCWPLYETEQDLQELRGIGRWFAAWDVTGASILTNLHNYTIGEGATTEAKPKHKSEEAKHWAAEVQRFCDEFDDLNGWIDETETEVFDAGVRDGDHMLRLKDRGPKAPKVQCVGGEHITEPNKPYELEEHFGLAPCDWRFGVATALGDTTDVRGYFVDWFGRSTDWDFIPADEAVFIKRNTPKQAKRGVSDFAVVWRELEAGAKLFRRTVKGATIQASIAYIKEAAQGTTQDALAGLVGGVTSPGTIRRPDGSTSAATLERHEEGKVVTTTGKYHAGPMGSPNGPTYVEIHQAVLRRVGSRWAMPEYMISGDASNANYASTLAAESPFTINTRQEQGGHIRRSRELKWKAIAMAAKHGRFDGMTGDQLRALVELDISLPNPESRDPLQIEQVHDAQQRAGILSARTRAGMSGLDYDEELVNGAKEAAPVPAVGNPVQERLVDLKFSLLEGKGR